jgi:rod shape-determining protein MreD
MGFGRYLSLPLLLVAVILQTTVIPEIRIGGGGPDLVLMMVIAWALLAEIDEAFIWAIVGGILEDLAVGLPTGTTALALVIVVFLVNLVVGNIQRNSIIVPPAVVAIATVLFHLLMLAILNAINRPAQVGTSLIYVTLPTVLFNLILMLPVFRLMGAIYEASRPRGVEL